MNWENTYYMLGSLFFIGGLVLVLVLIVAAVIMVRNVNRLQLVIQEALEERKSLTTVLPFVLMASFQARSWLRKLRG